MSYEDRNTPVDISNGKKISSFPKKLGAQTAV